MYSFARDIFVPNQASDNINILTFKNNYMTPTIKQTGDGPIGIAVDIKGNVIVSNVYDHSISIFNTLNNLSRFDISVGNAPTGVAVDYDGNIWVACSGGNISYPDGCVYRIDYETKAVTFYQTYYKPFGIAIDANGTVYTTHPEKKEETDFWCVSKLSKRRNYQYELITNLDAEPTGIAVDYNGNLWVSCADNINIAGKVNKLTLVNEIDCLYTKLEYTVEKSPYGIAIDRLGRVWVTNKGTTTVSRIVIADGSITNFNCYTSPHGISIDRDNNVWICNRELNKITKLLNTDYTQNIQYNVGNYPVGFGDMTGLSVGYIVNHFKYLIVDNNKIKTWNDSVWELLRESNIPVNDDFHNKGFARLIDLNESTIATLETSEFDILMWTDQIQNEYSIKTYAIPNHKLIIQNTDLSIDTVSKFNKVKVYSELIGHSAIFKIIVSTDSGNTWKTYTEGNWQVIDVFDLDNVKNNGMTASFFNNLSETNWFDLLNDATTLRFAYYLNIDELSDNVKIDKTEMDINIKGYWKPVDCDGPVTYEFRSLTELRVFITDNGNYKINYTIMRDKGSDQVSGGIEEWNQADIIAPVGTSSGNPYNVDLLIPYTEDFKRREPHVLKFIAGTQNVLRTVSDFDVTDNTNFIVLEDNEQIDGYLSKYVMWDGKMKYKTNYSFDMSDEGVLGEGRVYSIQIIRSSTGASQEEQFIGVIDAKNSKVYKFKNIASIEII